MLSKIPCKRDLFSASLDKKDSMYVNFDLNALSRELLKLKLERTLGAELIEHLDNEKPDDSKLAKGKNAIELASGEELIAALHALIAAAMAGELDTQIEAASGALRAGFVK